MSVRTKKVTFTQNGIKNKVNDHIITIFGGTGDLTYRKLLPAFYNLLENQHLPNKFNIVIIGRQDLSTEDYHELLIPWLKEHSRYDIDEDRLNDFLSMITYFEMVFTEDEGYVRLNDHFKKLNPDAKKLYYFAVSPSFFEVIAQKLSKHNCVKDAKIIIEKPFGNDLESAMNINETLTGIFGEAHIYRIDHYIAKEMVQNIFTIRFDNAIFKNIWNKDNISNIQISANETVGVESRGSYYDQTGALKDMFQNHLLQILSIVTMDNPDSMEALDIHQKQEAILEALSIEDFDKDIVLGQYVANKDSLSYLAEEKVEKDSQTETYVALKLKINQPQWEGVPIYVRTGKRLNSKSTHIAIEFKEASHAKRNILMINVQPEEGVSLRFNIKKPGQSNETQTVSMDFCQSCNYENRMNTPEAYERLLLAALEEDHTLFASFKQVKLSWELVETISSKLKNKKPLPYLAYTERPKEANSLFERDNQTWIEEAAFVSEIK